MRRPSKGQAAHTHQEGYGRQRGPSSEAVGRVRYNQSPKRRPREAEGNREADGRSVQAERGQIQRKDDSGESNSGCPKSC